MGVLVVEPLWLVLIQLLHQQLLILLTLPVRFVPVHQLVYSVAEGQRHLPLYPPIRSQPVL